MSLKKYRWIDLGILGIIGFTMELLGNYLMNVVFIAILVTNVISLLIVMTAVFRWGWRGLLLIPILAAATIISGRFINPKVDYRIYYDWALYLAIICQLLGASFSLLWFKKIKTEYETSKNLYCLFGLCAIVGIISILLLSFSYWLFSRRFLLYEFLAWDAIGYALLLVGCFILSRQGILVNVEEKLKMQKEEAEREKNFQMDLSENIEEGLEQKEGDFKDGKDS